MTVGQSKGDTAAVRPGEELNLGALRAHLETHLPGAQGEL